MKIMEIRTKMELEAFKKRWRKETEEYMPEPGYGYDDREYGMADD